MSRIRIQLHAMKHGEVGKGRSTTVVTAKVILDGKSSATEVHESMDEREANFQAALKAARQIYPIKREYLVGHELVSEGDELVQACIIIEQALRASEKNLPRQKSA